MNRFKSCQGVPHVRGTLRSFKNVFLCINHGCCYVLPPMWEEPWEVVIGCDFWLEGFKAVFLCINHGCCYMFLPPLLRSCIGRKAYYFGIPIMCFMAFLWWYGLHSYCQLLLVKWKPQLNTWQHTKEHAINRGRGCGWAASLNQ